METTSPPLPSEYSIPPSPEKPPYRSPKRFRKAPPSTTSTPAPTKRPVGRPRKRPPTLPTNRQSLSRVKIPSPSIDRNPSIFQAQKKEDDDVPLNILLAMGSSHRLDSTHEARVRAAADIFLNTICDIHESQMHGSISTSTDQKSRPLMPMRAAVARPAVGNRTSADIPESVEELEREKRRLQKELAKAKVGAV
ncbi:MAG: hypothetical protein Q9197_002311 [Variospora fuerteventurae]